MVLSWNKGKWLHSHETLINSKVTYNVKMVGVVEVGDARGMEIVKEAMQKLKFSRHIKRSEGSKPPKVELSINIQGMKLTDPRTKEVFHDIKLHHVSFCADDKEDKRMFSFIAKGTDGKHLCYGLDSLHEANDITLTIGQAFELAYDRYLKTDKGMATSKQVIELNKKIAELESENAKLKKWILNLESGKTPTSSPGDSPVRTRGTPTKSTIEDLIPTEETSLQDVKEESSCNHQVPSVSRQVSLSEYSSSSNECMTSSDLLNIFSDPVISSQPINKKYLEARFNSPSLPPARRLQKQAYIDQTIASVERAKASLKNLKEYVNQRKMKKKEKINSPKKVKEKVIGNCKKNSHEEDDENYEKISDIQETVAKHLANSLNKQTKDEAVSNSLAHKPLQRGVSTTLPSRTNPPSTLATENQKERRNSDASLYAGFNEVMGTLASMINHNSTSPSSSPRKEGPKTKNPKVTKSISSPPPCSPLPIDLPETAIDDVAESKNYMNVSYAKVQAKFKHLLPEDTPPALPPRDHPVIPPKPLQFLHDSLSTKSSSVCSLSTFSATDSDLSSSTDRHGVHSYCFDSPEGSLYVNKEPKCANKDVIQSLSGRTLPKVPENSGDQATSSVLDSTLGKYSGEDGYLLLKEARKIAETSVDGGEENVDSTYGTVHNLMKSVRNDVMRASWLKNHERTWKTKKKNDTADILDGQDLIDILSEAEKSTQSEAKPSPKKQRDVFDMQPFDGSSKNSKGGSPIIRLPSPDEVHPTRTSNRRRSNKQQNDLSKQLFDDPLGELSRLDRQLSLQSELSRQHHLDTNYENHSEILNKIMKTSKLSSVLQNELEDSDVAQEQEWAQCNSRSALKTHAVLDRFQDVKMPQQKQRLKNNEPESVKPCPPIMDPEISLDSFDPLK